MGADFDQRNTLSIAASDYGGGTPVANVWRRDAGPAVGHLGTRAAAAGPAGAQDRRRRGHWGGIAARGRPGAGTVVAHRRHLRFARTTATTSRRCCAAAPAWPTRGWWRRWCLHPRSALCGAHGATSATSPSPPGARHAAQGAELGSDRRCWTTAGDRRGRLAIGSRKVPRGDADMRDFVAAIRRRACARGFGFLAPLCADPGQRRAARPRRHAAAGPGRILPEGPAGGTR